MSQRWDVMTARSYADRDGNERTAWTRVGTMFSNRNGDGFSIALDALPLPSLKDGKLECRLVCMPPKEREEQPRRGGGGGVPADLNDSIPFSPDR